MIKSGSVLILLNPSFPSKSISNSVESFHTDLQIN